jgi:hypothetical protein
MIVGLWQVAAEAFAGQTEDVVHLGRAEVAWITGRHRRDAALTSLQRLCDVMAYSLERRGEVVAIHVRNFAKKQGFNSAHRGAHSAHSAPSELRRPNSEHRRPSERSAAPAAPHAPLEPEKLVNLLAQEPGEPEAKLAWLQRELPVIEAKAGEDHPDDPKRRMAGVRSRVLTHFRQHHKAQTAPPTAIPSRRSSTPSSDELWELRRRELLPAPTLDYWREWVAAGKPEVALWWVVRDAAR